MFLKGRFAPSNFMVSLVVAIYSISGYSCFVKADSFEIALLEGMANANLLAISRQDYITARQELIIAASDKDLSGKLSFSQSQTFYERPNQVDNTYNDATLAGAITFTKQLYNFGETKVKKDAASLSLEIAKAGYFVTEQAVLMSIIETYLNVIQSKEEVELFESNFDRLARQTEAEKLRVESGVSTKANLALSNSKLLSSRSELVAAKAVYENVVEEYESLIGVPPLNLSEPDLPNIIPKKVKLSENDAYKYHPSLILAVANKDLAALQQEILIKSLGPSVDLSISANNRNTGGVSASDGSELAATISMTMPILVTPSSKAQSQKLISNFMAAQIDTDEAKRAVGLAARAGFRNHISAKIQLKAAASEVEAYRLVVEATKAEVEFGNKTILDQLDAEDNLKNAILREMRANHSVLLTGYKLLQAMGTLTPENLGIGEKYIPLEKLEDPEPELKSFLSVFRN